MILPTDGMGFSGQERGCGTRDPGGIYAECLAGPGGRPIDDFVICSPIPLDPEIRLSPKGVKIIPHPSDPDCSVILDWVGAEHYPNVADFVEESGRFGVSRRLSPALDYSQIKSRSELWLVHPRAILDNARDLLRIDTAQGAVPIECPRERFQHRPSALAAAPDPMPMCAGFWWHDLDPATVAADGGRLVERRMPSFAYDGWRRPDGFDPAYAPGFFLRVPLTRLAVVNDPRAGQHVPHGALAAASGMPVVLVNE